MTNIKSVHDIMPMGFETALKELENEIYKVAF